MVGGNNIPKFEAAPPVWLKSLWEKPFLDGHAIPFLSVIELPKSTREINPNYVWGCNFSIRKQIVLDAGGFHPDGVPQDSIRFRGDGESCVSSYVERQGLRCIFDHRASVYHLVSKDRMTMEYFKKRAFNQGVSDSYRLLRQQGEVNQLTWKMTDLLMWLKQKAQTLKDITMNRHLSDKQQLEKLFKMIRNGYWEGFWYHRQAYTTDSEVRAWVHQGFYW
jgi:glucosyl-dolichyl phosphate glucuronosyltransferase